MKKLIFILVFMTVGFANANPCENADLTENKIQLTKYVSVSGDYSDIDIATLIEALQRTYAWFLYYDLDIDREFHIDFAPLVQFPLDADTMELVYGLACVNSGLIRMTTFDQIRATQRLVFGSPVTIEQHVGTLVHEMTHILVKHNAVPDLIMTPAAQEMWAYTVQIDTTTDRELGKIEANFPTPPFEFDQLAHITSEIYYLEPEGFGVAAFRWYERHGIEHMLKALEGPWLPDVRFMGLKNTSYQKDSY